MKSIVEAAGATLPRTDLPAPSCARYRRRGPTHGSQPALFAGYRYHGCITDRDGDNTLELEADHRRHAEIENAIRDLKYGVGLNHLPSGRFPANAAWLAVQVMAHNLARWTTRIGLGEPVATTKTLRRRFFSLAGRITRKARRLTLHLPQGWPWQNQFLRSRRTVRPAPTFLTAPDPTRQTIHRLGCPAPSWEQLVSCCHLISLSTTTSGRQPPLSATLAPRAQPVPGDQRPIASFPNLSSLSPPVRLNPFGGFGVRTFCVGSTGQ